MSDSQLPRLISELPTGWFWQSLGNCLKVRNGFAFKSSDYRQSGVLLIRQSNLGGNRVSLEKAEYLPEAFLKEHKDFRVKKGDVLIGMSGSIGKLCVYDRDEPALQNQRTGLLQFKDDSLRSWIWHYLPLLANKLHEGGKGVGVQNISASQIEALPIPIAPKEHRARIVEEIEKQFSRLDEAVANLKRVKVNLKRYKAAVLKAAVEGKLTEVWRKQHPNVEPASKLLERILAERRAMWKGKGKFKEPNTRDTTNLPKLPDTWTWATWESVLAIGEGPFKRGPFGSALKKSIFVSHGYKVYEQYCPINDDCSFARYYITPEKFEELRSFEVKAGDFLISCSGVTLGRITQVPHDLEKGIINQALLRVRLNKKVIDDGYFVRLFRSQLFQRWIFDNSTGSAIPNVKGVKELKAIPIPLPPLDEQQHIVTELERSLSGIEELQAAVEANLTRADRLRQSILSQAFAGRLLRCRSDEV